MRNTADITHRVAYHTAAIHGSQSISGVSAINPFVAFYDTHGRKREALFFYSVPDTTRHGYYRLVYAVINLHYYKYFSSIGTL
jgi:hypothetical protein